MADEVVDPKVRLNEAVIALRSMLRGNTVTEDQYHKLLVNIANEYALLDDLPEAVSLLQSMPMSYFDSVQAVQMAEDATFRQVCWDLAEKLLDAGIVELTPAPDDLTPAPTQKPGLC
jgi:hypothetical protein